MTYVTESGDALAQAIRIVDGNHDLGAAALADALIESGAVVAAADVWEEGYRHGRGKVDPAQVDFLNPYVQKVGHTDE